MVEPAAMAKNRLEFVERQHRKNEMPAAVRQIAQVGVTALRDYASRERDEN